MKHFDIIVNPQHSIVKKDDNSNFPTCKIEGIRSEKNFQKYIKELNQNLLMLKWFYSRRKSVEELNETPLYVDIKCDVIYKRFVEVVDRVDIFHEVFKMMFEHIEKFDFKNTPSVSSDYTVYAVANRYDALTKINLFDHTINVVFASLAITEKTDHITRGVHALIAMLHDFGKSRGVNEFTARNYIGNYAELKLEGHWQQSAAYADVILKLTGTPNDIASQISAVISNHHSKKSISTPHNPEWMAILRQADETAREWELKYLNEKYGYAF